MIVVQPVFVKKDPEEGYYQVGVISKEGVPEFGPEVGKNTAYKKNEEFRDFLYSKCNFKQL